MESDDETKAFDDYIAITFPEDKKRNRSGVIHRSLGQYSSSCGVHVMKVCWFIIIIIIITSSGDLQPSTAIANQLLGKSV